MSTKRGESVRKRPQKHQNTKAWKPDLYDKSPLTAKLLALDVANVCEKCKKVIEWKIKFKKFKVRKAPGTCTKCAEKNVKHAYHIMCKPCSAKHGVCPKCGNKEELVEPQPTPEEQLKMDLEIKAMLKTLSERKRRTFLRYLEKANGGKKRRKRKDSLEDEDDEELEGKSGSKEENSGSTVKGTQALLELLERLKLSCQKGEKLDDFGDLDDLDDSDLDDLDELDFGDEDGEDDDDSNDDDNDEEKGKEEKDGNQKNVNDKK